MTGARRVRYHGKERVGLAETMKTLGINMFRVAKYIINKGLSYEPIANIASKIAIFSTFCTIREKINLIYGKYSAKSIFVKYIPQMA